MNVMIKNRQLQGE